MISQLLKALASAAVGALVDKLADKLNAPGKRGPYVPPLPPKQSKGK